MSEQSPAKYQRPDDTEIRGMLSDIQYQVTQKEGTERPLQQCL